MNLLNTSNSGKRSASTGPTTNNTTLFHPLKNYVPAISASTAANSLVSSLINTYDHNNINSNSLRKNHSNTNSSNNLLSSYNHQLNNSKYVLLPSMSKRTSREDDNDLHGEEDELATMENVLSNNYALPKAKMKYTELGNKINSLDAQIMQQDKLRKKRQQQLENLDYKIDSLASQIKKTVDSIEALDAKIDKVENLIHQEKGARELQEKNIIALIEEKFASITTKIEQEKYLRNTEYENNRKKVKSLEEEIGVFHLNLESLEQGIDSVSQQIVQITTSTSNFQNQYKVDKKAAADSQLNDLKEIQGKIVELKQKQHNMELDITKQNEQLISYTNSQFVGVTGKLTQLQQDFEQSSKTITEPLWQQITLLLQQIENNKLQVNQQVGTLQQQILQTKVSILNESIKPEISKLEKLIYSNNQQSKQKDFELKSDIDKLQEQTTKLITKIEERMTESDEQRNESETNILKLLSKTMSRIKNGIEVTALEDPNIL
ncbi:hypothetical protein ABK040_015134 [Willaertia magna]